MNLSVELIFIVGMCLASIDVTAGQHQQRSPFRSFGSRARSRDGGRRSPAFAAAEDSGPPEPFEFSYASSDEEGSHSHNQQGDANGRINGEYEIQLADGRSRVVKYYADDSGFYADVVTNELGTESKDPADVTFQSSAPTGPEAALAAERTRSTRPRRSGAPRIFGGFRRHHG